MVLLELKGCGVLSEASISCPLLTSLDASFCRLCSLLFYTSLTLTLPSSLSGEQTKSFICFVLCSQLRDDCLSATAASCPLIESLILMSCPSVGSDGLYSLRWLPNLIVLDLSYTFLMSLKPVFESCIKLKVIFATPYCSRFVGAVIIGVKILLLVPQFQFCNFSHVVCWRCIHFQ